jgi:metal-sulfur cluster biosynthetic enzyme
MRLFPAHYRLYKVLIKEGRPPTTDELDIIQGQKVMDKLTAEQYCEKLDNISNNIRDMLERQAAANQVQVSFSLLSWF